MASVNKKELVKTEKKTTTYGGAPILKITNNEELLRRSVMSCMLWENSFYEDGESIVNRIKSYIPKIDAERVAEIAIEARSLMHLRHVPLLIVREMARLDSHKHIVARTLEQIIQRPDEITEFMAIYWKDKKEPISSQVKKGLGKAFSKFSEYQLAKWDKNNSAIKLRDVLFLCHAKPETGVSGFTKEIRKNKKRFPKDEGSQLFKKIVEGKLETPDTWEVNLSAGENKKETWKRLISENKLGGLALIRNLRNMEQVGVDNDIISESIKSMKIDRILPFRFIMAAKHAPRFESELEQALFRATEQRPKLKGKTILIVDVSGSMYGSNISKYSDADRATVACSLAMLTRESCETPVIYATAGNDGTRVHKTMLVPSRRGFALSSAIFNMCSPLGGGGIFLKQVMDYVRSKENSADRIIVITDEQDCDTNTNPDKADAFGKANYIINVASHDRGIGYGKWTHINGWSDAVLDYIRIMEEGIPKSDNIPTLTQKKVKVYAKSRSKKTHRDSRKRLQRNRKSRTRV